jgi:putative hydrolase of HD superfamily
VKTKAPHPTKTKLNTNTNPVIAAYFEFCHLKNLYRQGWLSRGIPEQQCESVADHTFGVALIAMIIADLNFPELDGWKVLRMALIHDIGEVHAGDIVPDSRITPESKHRKEKDSIRRVFEGIPHEKDYLDLWEEFEIGESPEARFVQQIDKLEMALQASVYEHGNSKDLSDFYVSAGRRISNPKIKSILKELEDLS